MAFLDLVKLSGSLRMKWESFIEVSHDHINLVSSQWWMEVKHAREVLSELLTRSYYVALMAWNSLRRPDWPGLTQPLLSLPPTQLSAGTKDTHPHTQL